MASLKTCTKSRLPRSRIERCGSSGGAAEVWHAAPLGCAEVMLLVVVGFLLLQHKALRHGSMAAAFLSLLPLLSVVFKDMELQGHSSMAAAL